MKIGLGFLKYELLEQRRRRRRLLKEDFARRIAVIMNTIRVLESE